MVAHLGSSTRRVPRHKILVMQGETRERWHKLCEQAAIEEDPEKLVEIFKEIIHMLDEKAARLFKAYMNERVDSKPN